jgi:hypothetical protein
MKDNLRYTYFKIFKLRCIIAFVIKQPDFERSIAAISSPPRLRSKRPLGATKFSQTKNSTVVTKDERFAHTSYFHIIILARHRGWVAGRIESPDHSPTEHPVLQREPSGPAHINGLFRFDNDNFGVRPDRGIRTAVHEMESRPPIHRSCVIPQWSFISSLVYPLSWNLSIWESR